MRGYWFVTWNNVGYFTEKLTSYWKRMSIFTEKSTRSQLCSKSGISTKGRKKVTHVKQSWWNDYIFSLGRRIDLEFDHRIASAFMWAVTLNLTGMLRTWLIVSPTWWSNSAVENDVLLISMSFFGSWMRGHDVSANFWCHIANCYVNVWE